MISSSFEIDGQVQNWKTITKMKNNDKSESKS